MKYTDEQREILRALALHDGVMSQGEVASETALANARVSKVLHELASQKGSPLIERREIEEGVYGYKCVADPILIESILEDMDDGDASVAAPIAPAIQRPSSVVQLSSVSRPATIQEVVQKQVEEQDQPEPRIAAQEMFGISIGSDDAVDDILRALLIEPQNGSDLLKNISSSGDVATNALNMLAEMAIITSVDMEDDIFYRMSDALNEGEKEELQKALNRFVMPAAKSSAQIENAQPSSASASAPAPAPAPAPISSPAPIASQQTAPALSTGGFGFIPTDLPDPAADASEGGKVASRKAKARVDALTFINNALSGGAVAKLTLSKDLEDIATVRGAKDLLAELIDGGHITEYRDGKTKFLKLPSQSAASTANPAPVLHEKNPEAPIAAAAKPSPAVSPVASPASAQPVLPRSVADVPARVMPNDVPVAPAAVAARAKPEASPAAQSIQHIAPAARANTSSHETSQPKQGEAAADGIQAMLSGLASGSFESGHLVSTALTQLASYVRDLETQNRTYREILGQFAIGKTG